MLLISIIPEWKPADVMSACLERAAHELKPSKILLVGDGPGGAAAAKELMDAHVVQADIEDMPDNSHHSRRVAQLREVARLEGIKADEQSVFWLDCDVLLPKKLGAKLRKLIEGGGPCFVTSYPDRLAGYTLPSEPLPGVQGIVEAGKVTGMGACWMDSKLLASKDFASYIEAPLYPDYGEDMWFMDPLQERGLVQTTGAVAAHFQERGQCWRVWRKNGVYSVAGRKWGPQGVPVKLSEQAGGLAVPGAERWQPGETKQVNAEHAAALLGNSDFSINVERLPKLALPEGY